MKEFISSHHLLTLICRHTNPHMILFLPLNTKVDVRQDVQVNILFTILRSQFTSKKLRHRELKNWVHTNSSIKPAY